MSASQTPLLDVSNLRKTYAVAAAVGSSRAGTLKAVDGVTFAIRPRETLALVGESGCGKTSTARMILRLETPTSGSILFRGAELKRLRGQGLREYRASVSAVFQDPGSSLSPRLHIREIIGEPLIINRHITGAALDERVRILAITVGLDASVVEAFPHELSGGQRQRVAIARALSLDPALVILDEPVSSLDVSIGAQILNLLRDLQGDFGAAYLLIAHNLAAVKYLADRVLVMYLGAIVESGSSHKLFSNPLHPYTKALLSAARTPSAPPTDRLKLRDDIASGIDMPSGCRFRNRCPLAFDRCVTEAPEEREVEPGQRVACHLY